MKNSLTGRNLRRHLSTFTYCPILTLYLPKQRNCTSQSCGGWWIVKWARRDPPKDNHKSTNACRVSWQLTVNIHVSYSFSLSRSKIIEASLSLTIFSLFLFNGYLVSEPVCGRLLRWIPVSALLYCIELFVFMIEVKLLYLRSLLLYVIQKRYFYPDFPIGPSRVLIYLVYSGNFVGNFMSTVTACLVSTLKSSAEIYQCQNHTSPFKVTIFSEWVSNWLPLYEHIVTGKANILSWYRSQHNR